MDVAELIEAFKDHQQSANHAQLLQRVQELMGQGIDASSLFPNIVSSVSTRDITIKKAAYSFLARYGRTSEEFCVLSINTLHQDCADLDPTIRALALRTLCSLGQKSLLRFTLQPLNKGFQDKNAHVRKTAVMACISLFELDPVFLLESEIVDKLYAMLRDRDTQVVVNAILALEAILVDEGGIVINQNIATHLIQRYKDWSPSQLQVVLGVLCRYKPQTSDDVYEIMNDLDDGVQHTSLAVQVATLRLFLWLCQDMVEIQEELQKTIEETLLKHLDSPVPDLVYASLSHLALIVEANGTLQHTTPQQLSALFCRLDDPVPVKLQKLTLCVKIAQSSNSTSADTPRIQGLILDHLCQVAGMKEVAIAQKSSRTKFDRASLTAHVEVACRAIESIANVGTGTATSPNQHSTATLPPSPQPRPIGARSMEDKGMVRCCMDRLFRLLVFFASMEHVSEEGRKDGRGDTGGHNWLHKDIADLGLDDSQVALLLSTVMTAIEACWQQEFDNKQRGEKTIRSGSSVGIGGGAFNPFQIKALGLLLLRHLDQGELDRLAKKRKPLRFRYDVEQDRSSTSSPTLESSIYEQRQQEPGDMSRLARISGIKMLLLEEAAQLLHLQQQLQKLSEATATTTDTHEGTQEDHSPAQETDTKRKAIQTALEKRSQYALLLQQQVQDLVQSIDTRRTLTGSMHSNNQTYWRTRAEQIAILSLACHLVAFSIETDSGNGEDMSETALDLLSRRVEILAQAVDQLIPGPGSRSTHLGEDLLSLDAATTVVHDTPASASIGGHKQHPSVARDVADRARLIEAFFLVPLSKILATSSGSVLDNSKSAPRTISLANQFDSPVLKTEIFLNTVKRKVVEQYGVKARNNLDDLNRGFLMDHHIAKLENIEHTMFHDWAIQVGFNTLAVTR